jgi:crotonobetainyl-CoA:carnitine CoA-transferase CaiB-like acyl-CoA transferase
MTKPLEGILVADFTTLLPGPLATLMLAEAGAEVVKIERPGGETARVIAPFLRGHSAAFAMLNRGEAAHRRLKARRAVRPPTISSRAPTCWWNSFARE